MWNSGIFYRNFEGSKEENHISQVESTEKWCKKRFEKFMKYVILKCDLLTCSPRSDHLLQKLANFGKFEICCSKLVNFIKVCQIFQKESSFGENCRIEQETDKFWR